MAFGHCFLEFTRTLFSSPNSTRVEYERGIAYIKNSRRDSWSTLQQNRHQFDCLATVTFRNKQILPGNISVEQSQVDFNLHTS